MARWVGQAGLEYRWVPALGGRRRAATGSPNVALRNPQFRGYADHMRSEEFRRGCAELVELARSSAVAVVCAESLWWRCHRRLLADHLVLVEGVPVDHVLPDGRVTAHEPTAAARREADHLVYDVMAQQELFEE